MIPQLTHKNHFKYGYDRDWFTNRKEQSQQWTVSYGKCCRQTKSFKEECLLVARQIRIDADKDIVILFSGGVDSEVVLRSFFEAGIQVTAAILRFKNNLNLHDIAYAVTACEKLGIAYRFYELDILEFWKTSLLLYATPNYCISPQLLSTMWLVDQVEGYPVMGSGECLLVKDIPAEYVSGISPYVRSAWHLFEKEKIAAWFRHFQMRNKNGCPGFFQYTPEIILSYLLDPFVQKLTSDQVVGKLCTASSKLKIYQQYFDVVDRPKFSGFEKVLESDSYYRKILTDLFPGTNQIFKSDVDELIQSMSFKE